MALPPRIKRERVDTGREKRDRCPSHLAFVRSHGCCVPGCDERPIEAAHVRSGTDGGIGLKPSDCWSISLCAAHHRQQHAIGEPAFEREHGIDMKRLAREFSAASQPWKRHLANKAHER